MMGSAPRPWPMKTVSGRLCIQTISKKKVGRYDYDVRILHIPVIAKTRGCKSIRSMEKGIRSKGRWAGLGFALPFLLVFFVATILPIIYALYLSLFRDQLIGGSCFVGLANYMSLLGSGTFWDGVWRVIRVFLIQVSIMLGLALLAALYIDSGRLRGHGFFPNHSFPAVCSSRRCHSADMGVPLWRSILVDSQY